MLGTQVSDPMGIEGAPGTDAGLGLLDIETEMTPSKQLTQVTAKHCATGALVDGYEIHIGRSYGSDSRSPFAEINGAPEGAISSSGQVIGTYLHGLFRSDTFRSAFLHSLGVEAGASNYSQTVEQTLEDLAQHMEQNLDVDGLLATAR